MLTLIRGGGDLASGVALRLFRSGLSVVITELPQPLVVRRAVSFAETVFLGQAQVEEVKAHLAEEPGQVPAILQAGKIPVLVDPQGMAIAALEPEVLVDGRMLKRPPEIGKEAAPLVIGLGPGFVAGENCHAAIETNRGHFLGRVFWSGAPQPDTGIPEGVQSYGVERVLRSPTGGVIETYVEIGDHVEPGQRLASVGGQPVTAPFSGVVRGLVHPGLQVRPNTKIGDIDPRDDPEYCHLVSDKALAVGGGVLEAILSRPDLRSGLCR